MNVYDRVPEREKITDFIFKSSDEYLVVHGNSGSGKSTIIDKILRPFNIDEILRYKFVTSSIPFPLYDFIRVYYNNKKPPLKRIKDTVTRIRLKPPGISSSANVSVGLGLKDVEIKPTLDNMEQLFYGLSKLNVKVIYIQNIEYLSDVNDELFLKNLHKISTSGIKIILEIGNLIHQQSNFLNHARKHDFDEIEVKNFDEFHTKKLYRFIHNSTPPPDIFGLTRGNPFYLVHYNVNCEESSMEQWIKNKIANLNNEEKRLLFQIHILDNLAYYNTLIGINGKNKFYDNISTLNIQELIKISRDENFYEIKHSHISQVINKEIPSYVLNDLRIKVANYFNNKKKKTVHQNYFVCLQFYLSKNFQSTINSALEIIIVAYTSQKYHYVISAIEILFQLNSSISKFNLKLIYIQAHLLLGSLDKDTHYYISSIKYNTDTSLILLSMYKSLINNFTDALKVIDDIIIKCHHNPYRLILLHGISLSCHLGMGNRDNARNHYSSMEILLSKNNYAELQLEIIRLAPKFYGHTIGANKIEDQINNMRFNKYLHSKAKSLHNCGFSKILINPEDLIGVKYLQQSRDIFEENSTPEISYSIVAQSVLLLFREDYDSAISILLEGLNYAHEQYDHFAIYTNLGISMVFKNNLDKAFEYFTKAQKNLSDPLSPLNDPVLINKSRHNLALINAIKGNWNIAKELINLVEIPTNSRFENHRTKRLNLIVNNFQVNKIPLLIDNCYDNTAWPVTKFIFAIGKLSFYDFNIKIITNKKLKEMLS